MKALMLLVILSILGYIKNNILFFFGIGLLIGMGSAIIFGFKYQLFKIDISKIDWVALSAIALIITLFYIARQTEATKIMAKYQLMLIIPAVDVKMIYDENVNKSYFLLSNLSNIPALISFNISFFYEKFGQKNYVPFSYRVEPLEKNKETMHVFFDCNALTPNNACVEEVHLENVQATINFDVKPAVENIPLDIKFNFKKTYNFHSNKWDIVGWGDRERLNLYK